MTNTQHTQERWYVYYYEEGEPYGIYNEKDNEHVVSFEGYDVDPDVANLIASSPEMLEVLKDTRHTILETLGTLDQHTEYNDCVKSIKIMEEQLDNIYNIIKKAKGL